MMNPFVRRISKRLHPLWDLIMSAVGGFTLLGGSGLFATGKAGSDTAASTRAAAPSRKPLAGTGAAVFLLAFITSEALATIGTFCH
jgi:hypothetical protein